MIRLYHVEIVFVRPDINTMRYNKINSDYDRDDQRSHCCIKLERTVAQRIIANTHIHLSDVVNRDWRMNVQQKTGKMARNLSVRLKNSAAPQCSFRSHINISLGVTIY